MAHDLVFLENRRTPKVVKSGEKYEASEAEGKITKRRAATEAEEKVINRGDWVRVNEKGETPGDDSYMDKKSKVRPQHNPSLSAGACTCCEGTGEHADGHECYVCDAGMTREAQMESESEFCEGHHGVPDDGPENAKERYGDDFEHYSLLAAMTAAAGPTDDGYSGVTHAGIALVSVDGLSVFLAQRAYDETDDPDVQETWEFVGGGLEEGEEVWAAAEREWGEEIGVPLPAGEVVNGWRSDDGVYQGFVYKASEEFDPTGFVPTDEVQAVAWVRREDLPNYTLRPEVEMGTDWDMIFGSVSGNEDKMDEPTYSADDFSMGGPIPVHGVIAPEEMSSGDKRAFAAGSMTRRPLRLPFSDQHTSVGGHDGSVVVGSVDRIMRKDGMIHWEGALMEAPETENLVARMQFFDGRYGVSVDGDNGSLDEARSEETGTAWFDNVRASGLTAVAIPAFHEAYVAFGTHPDMPSDEALSASAYESGDLIGGQRFARGPGWVTNPRETNRIHDYWTKKGEPGYAKVGWGTPGDFTRAKKLIGAKIAEHSPDKVRFLNQIIAQWHFDALGYWPGDLGKPGNAPDTAENRKRAAIHAATQEVDFDALHDLIAQDDNVSDLVSTSDEESVWEAVLVSSVSGNASKRPALSYFHQHPSMVEDPWAAESAALRIEDPDEMGFRRVWGYAAQWGVCHVGFDGRCVEPPRSYSDDYPEFHLGRTKTEDGYVQTGVLTYGVGHRDAQTILSESATQAYYDNIRNAWAAVRCGENERGIWFSGVVLPKVDAGDLVKIEASGQVSGEWRAKAMRACLTVNVPGFPNEQPTAVYDAAGNVMAMAASAFGQVPDSPCSDSPAERMAALRQIDAEVRFARLKEGRV